MITVTLFLDERPILRWETKDMFSAVATAEEYISGLQADENRIRIEYQFDNKR